MAVSANRLELLQIADAVAREKTIDRRIVIAAMEDAIQKAANSRYGAETDIRAEIDPKTGEIRLQRLLEVVENVEIDAAQIAVEEARVAQSRRAGRRLHLRAAAAARFRPHRRPVGQAGHHAEGARGRARPPVRGIQGPHRRDRQRHGQARRIRQRHRRSRPRRGDHPPRRADPARDLPLRRPRARLCLRRAPRAARPADLPVAHASAIHGEALHHGSAGNLRRHHRDQVGRPRSGQPRQDRRRLARHLDRPGRRLRRHARQPRPGGGRRARGREDRHHSVEPRTPRPSSSTRCSRPRSPRSCSTRMPSASRSSFPTTSCRSPSAAAARTCASPRSSPAGTSTS